MTASDDDVQQSDVSVWKNSKRYSYVSADGELVGLHQLTACLHTDPAEVFAPDTEVHHRLDTGYRVDIPENVETLRSSEHAERHATETRPEPDDVLAFDSGGT